MGFSPIPRTPIFGNLAVAPAPGIDKLMYWAHRNYSVYKKAD
jgi:hypothetical protein